MKKRIALLLIFVLLLTASGCGSSIDGYVPSAGLTVNYLQGMRTQLVSTGSFTAMSEDGHIVGSCPPDGGYGGGDPVAQNGGGDLSR